MPKVKRIVTKTTDIVVECDCGKEVVISGDHDEDQSEYGEVSIEANCPFCESEINLVINLEEYE